MISTFESLSIKTGKGYKRISFKCFLRKFLISDLIKEITRDWQKLSISIPNGACEIFTCPPDFPIYGAKYGECRWAQLRNTFLSCTVSGTYVKIMRESDKHNEKTESKNRIQKTIVSKIPKECDYQSLCFELWRERAKESESMNIICVGEMLIDLIAHPVEQVSFQNDVSQIENIQITVGGDASNNAVNLSKLGHHVTYMGRIGYGDTGDLVIARVKKHGINMDHVVRSETAEQGKSLILVNQQGARTFLQNAGTSAEFCFEDCDLALLDDADILQIAGAFHMPRFDGTGSAKLLKIAQEKGVITSMDVTTDRTGRWKGVLDVCYPYLDYFLPSIEQAVKMSGMEEPAEIADFFLDQGVKNVVIKLGEKGSYFKNRNTAFYAGTYGNLRVVETTGAGDAFCAGFLTGVGLKASPRTCVAMGTACSAFVIQAIGATTGAKDLETVQQFIREQPPLEFSESTLLG